MLHQKYRKLLVKIGRSAELLSQQQSCRVAGIQQRPGRNFAGSSAEESCRAAVIKQMPPQHTAAKVSVSLPVCREQSRGSQLEHYNFNSNPRGLCVIIDCVGNDGGMLEKTFKDLHFHVIIYQWLRAEEILSSLREILRHRENHTGDGFVCCIISRGTATHLFGTDTCSNRLPLDTIRRLFNGNGCPMLAGKPKLFFIQRYSIPDTVPHNRTDHWDEELEIDGYSSTPGSTSIPADADVFWSHCWVDERHLQHGEHHSVYLKALTEALHKAQRRKTNFFDVHTEVNRVVFEHNRRNPGAAYHMDVKQTLRKSLYLE